MSENAREIDALLRSGARESVERATQALEERFKIEETVIDRFGTPSLNALGWVCWSGSEDEVFWTELDYSHYFKHWLVGKYLLQDRFVDAEVFSSYGFTVSDDVIVPGLLRMKKLRRLDLRSSFMKKLPVDICSLQGLETLILSGNFLESLPSEIGQLRSLKQLWLNHNHLRVLPESLGQLHELQLLRLNCNGDLRALPDSMGHLQSLSSLNLKQTAIKSLSGALLALPCLRQLYVNRALQGLGRGECISLSYDFWSGSLSHRAAILDMKNRVESGGVDEISLALGSYPADYEVVKEALQRFPDVYVHHQWRREAYY